MFTAYLKSLVTVGISVMASLADAQAKPQTPSSARAITTPPVQLVDAFPKLRFSRPLYLASVPDGSKRLVVVQQGGRIVVFPKQASAKKAETFLDISDRVQTTGGEEGLLGLAFDPDYQRNRHYYVNYTAAAPRRTIIARYTGQDPKSEKIILEIPQPYANHNGGSLVFGPDGYLYIGVGDGGAANDPHGYGQSLKTLLGKILRIDPRSGTPYKIPPDNPFVGVKDAKAEIWAYGLRNPWRIAFDYKTGELWAGDVGQNHVEEVDIIIKGGNYGWRECEGHLAMPELTKSCPKQFIAPIITYDHDSPAKSVTGGYVYRGQKLEFLRGAYIYADFIDRRIWALRKEDGVQNTLIATADLPVSSFGEDDDGELYVIGYGDNEGRIWTLAASANSRH